MSGSDVIVEVPQGCGYAAHIVASMYSTCCKVGCIEQAANLAGVQNVLTRQSPCGHSLGTQTGPCRRPQCAAAAPPRLVADSLLQQQVGIFATSSMNARMLRCSPKVISYCTVRDNHVPQRCVVASLHPPRRVLRGIDCHAPAAGRCKLRRTGVHD